MAWTTPKEDFAASEVVGHSHMNAIGANLSVLKTSVNDDGTLKPFRWGRITADVTKTTDTTLSNLTGMSFTVEANKNYFYEFNLKVLGNSTADWKFAVTFPSAPTDLWYHTFGSNPNSSSDAVNEATTTAGANVLTHGISTETCVGVRGVLRNGANAGTVQLQWAQRTSSGSSTIRAGSFYLVRELQG